MGKAIEVRTAADVEVPLIGRREDLRDLLTALRDCRSRLLLGAPGAGKTRLIREAILEAGQACVVVQRPRVLHELLVECTKQLNCRSAHFPTLDRATSIALKPLVVEALRRKPQCVVIEDLTDADPRMYRFLQELYYVPRACLIVSATSRASLGFLRKLLWDPREEISLAPLGRSESQSLFGAAADRFELRTLDLADFRRKVLAAAGGNPGQILSMCRLACRAEYQAGRHIKFLPLRIDALSSMCYE
jgi:predicted ATPase